MASFNKVILLGNLTRDPELKHVAGNQAVAELGLAVNRRFRTKDNEEREEVTFVDCEAWGRTAEVLKQYLTKGSPIFIEGRLKLDQWESKEGERRSKLRVVIENFQFIGSRGEGSGTGASGHARASRGSSGGGGSGGGEHVPLPSDDIPF
ncbi:MAG: single-stranded DNA-binding protein [Planctomycetes bacterium]|nr:single-stranded DNA-binding protein [Planctomycetota bacterium]